MTDHPYDVLALPDESNLIFTPCPGTKDTSIADALQTLKSAGAEAIITVLPDTELAALSVASLSEEAKNAHITWYQLPIDDDAEPEAAFEQAWNSHKAALIELGVNWTEVKQQIQCVRHKALSHPAHVAYLNKHLAL